MVDDACFAWMYVMLYSIIVPDVAASCGHHGIVTAAQADWTSCNAGTGMGHSAFAGYLKSLANNFTLSSDAMDHAMFLDTVLQSALHL